MTILGKTETTQQSGDNSTNIYAGRDVAYYGLSYRDVRDIVDDMLRDIFNQLSRIAREEAQKSVHAFLERCLSMLPQDKFHRFQDPKVQMFLHDVFSVFLESDGDEDVEKILFNALKANLDDADRQKNAVIRRAVQVLPLLSHEHIDYLSFLYCSLRMPSLDSDVYNAVKNTHEIVTTLYSDSFLENDFLLLLQEVQCLQSIIDIDNKMTPEMFYIKNNLNCYLWFDSYKISIDKEIKNIFKDDCQESFKLFKAMTYDELEYSLRNINLGQYSFKLFLFLHNDFPEEVKTALSAMGPKLQRFTDVWNDIRCIHSKLALTTVGKAIALFNCKAKMKSFEEVAFTIY